MGNSEQREFLASLRRAQINQLCLEMQSIISNFKLFLSEAHGYTDADLSKIMVGRTYDELETAVENTSARPTGTEGSKAESKPAPSSKAKSLTQPKPADLDRLKKEDEMIRRSMTFELEWCIAQIQRGNYPH
jgi:hypothetical protein